MMGDEGVLSLLDALLKSNKNLLRLSLNRNDLSDSTVCEKIHELVKTRKSLEMVEIKGNDFTVKDKEELKDKIEVMDRSAVVVFWGKCTDELTGMMQGLSLV